MSASWIAPSPAHKYGGSFVRPQEQTRTETQMTRAAGPPPPAAGGTFSPRSPLFWFAAIAATSLGLIGYSTTVRVGGTEASASIGKGS